MSKYIECSKAQVPSTVRFDVALRNQGQIIEVAYGGFERSEHDEGAPYMRVHDHSIGPEAKYYYRLLTDAH